GVKVQFEKPFSSSVLRVEGSLIAEGTEESPIIFTLEAHNSLLLSGKASLKNVIVEYGAGIFVTSSDVTISDSIIRNSATTGIRIADSSPIITNNTITGNAGAGISISDSNSTITGNTISNNDHGIYISGPSNPAIASNNIDENRNYGIYNADSPMVTNAENNWWGDASGPYHPSLNPEGMGERVSDNVDFEPWLTSPVGVQATIVSISPQEQTVASGETFTVEIMVEPGVPIGGVQFDLSFDPLFLSVDGIEEGDLLTRYGASTYFKPGAMDNVAGSITGVAGAIVSPGETVSSPGTFAIVTFRAKAASGTSHLDLSNVLVRGAEGHPVPLQVNDGSVIINQPPNQPSNVWPGDETTGIALTPTLQSSAFSDPDAGDSHIVSQWQITTASGDYSSPVFDSGVDTANLTSITIPTGILEYAITYYWRIRHQDNHGAWSEWSVETSFTTMRRPADVSGDGRVDAVDLAATASAFNSKEDSPNWNPAADLNQDGIVDIFDLVLVGRNFGGGNE
ncbi:right-handed parallel beta-helix repeat-containing protein, partial [Dehalococcoidia bacterium]|nr:right-handed parallel beta-helix repeat-containing protein [Dehalococcoidia bacterium]